MTSRLGFLSILASLVLAGAARADDPKATEPGPWKFTTALGVNFSQSAFSTNWAGGDRGSLVWVVTSQSGAERQFNPSFNLSNTLSLAYGQTAQQVRRADNELQWHSPDKTTDAILFQSLARWTLHRVVDPYVAFNVESQFQDQTDPRGIIRFNPVKLRETAGIACLLFKTEESEGLTRVGFGFRQTFARSFTDPAGLVKKSFTTNDGGIEWQTDVKRPMLQKKVLYQGRLLAFQPLFSSKKDDIEEVDALLRAADPTRESIADFWKTVNLDFLSSFSAQIYKAIGVNLTAQWIYQKFDPSALIDPDLAASPDPAVRTSYAAQIDKNARKAGQFREVFSLAITYRVL